MYMSNEKIRGTDDKNKHATVLVFGVFDGIHPGHRYLFRNARKYGDHLVAAVARDEVVRRLKRHAPRLREGQRLGQVRKISQINRAVLGDGKLGSYGVIHRIRPRVVCLGYDQDKLAADIRRRVREGYLPNMRLVRISALKPRKYKSSILRVSRMR